jgi:ribosomal protein L29
VPQPDLPSSNEAAAGELSARVSANLAEEIRSLKSKLAAAESKLAAAEAENSSLKDQLSKQIGRSRATRKQSRDRKHVGMALIASSKLRAIDADDKGTLT